MKKIGVFDSGLGGLTVVSQIFSRLPGMEIMYFADNAHVPYGERPLEQIREFALSITSFLIECGAEGIVMACNMSSAVALPVARKLYPDLPVLGVIRPGARAAVRWARGRPVGVLATSGTVRSGAYTRAIHEISPTTNVIEQACPKFVPLVEAGMAETEEAEAAAREYTAPLIEAGVHVTILGCTHYPFLLKAISAALGPEAILVDPAEETVEELKNLLPRASIPEAEASNTDIHLPRHRFFTSGEPESFIELGSRFLSRPIESVEKVTWGIDIGKVLI